MKDRVLVVSGISKSFKECVPALNVLSEVSFSVDTGETVAVVGNSGCGKTTLLHILGLVDSADSGDLLIDGQSCFGLSESEKNKVLSHKIGIVYQFHHLMSELSVVENVALPLLIIGVSNFDANKKAAGLLSSLDLSSIAHRLPSQISGGERQRVAIARAIIREPRVILADEPTGSLDPKTGNEVFELLVERSKSIGAVMICVTHNHELARRLDKIFTIVDGNLQSVS